MDTFKGKSIFNGIAIGKIFFYSKDEQNVKLNRIDNSEVEIERYEVAKRKALEQLKILYNKAVDEVGEENAEIFEVHAMMIEDEDYNDSIKEMINNEKFNAEFAVSTTGNNFSNMFANMDDEYFKARSIDVKDISERIILSLTGGVYGKNIGEESVIVVAKDLAPSETVQMDKSKLLGFVTELGSSNSHTAILARTMNIPALIGIEMQEEWNGKMAIIDGFNGMLYVEPNRDLIYKYTKKQQEELNKREMLQSLKGKENVTIGGKKINIYANIGKVSDVDAVIENDAGGIGLFRSEFLYLEKNNYPTEEEQFQAYKEVAQRMDGKKVIIRTLDIGADKQVDYFNLDHEDNPAMGYRAIRICLNRIEVFKAQLRAILRASAYGNIAIMYPMIISVLEVKEIKNIIEEVKIELDQENIKYGKVEQGIMIETPAAALISDLLAKEVDFFSIGTNDLTQYTLAIDRQNSKLDHIYDSHHEAVLRLIKMVVDNAHREGIWVGICGELGADLTLTEKFLEMNLDEISVSPPFVLALRQKVRETK